MPQSFDCRKCGESVKESFLEKRGLCAVCKKQVLTQQYNQSVEEKRKKELRDVEMENRLLLKKIAKMQGIQSTKDVNIESSSPSKDDEDLLNDDPSSPVSSSSSSNEHYIPLTPRKDQNVPKAKQKLDLVFDKESGISIQKSKSIQEGN